MRSLAFLLNKRGLSNAHLWLFLALISVALMTVTAPAQADDEEIRDRGYRWFEVEVLVFKYLTADDEQQQEQFPLPVQPIVTEGSRDIFTPRLVADIRGFINALPSCSGTLGYVPWLRQRLLTTASLRTELQQYSAERISCRRLPHLPLVDSWYLGQEEFTGQLPQRAPLLFSGFSDGSRSELLRAEIPFLVNQEQFEFNALRRQLERRGDTQPIVHASWRQPVFTRNVGRKMRVFGGRNFSAEFDYFGQPISPTPRQQALSFMYEPVTLDEFDEDQFSRLNRTLAALDQGTFRFKPLSAAETLPPLVPARIPRGLPEEVWELDGLLHLYLVGNFLHVDLDFNLRDIVQLEAEARHYDEQVNDFLSDDQHQLEFLRAYPLKQLRRVISHQTHYFDHPHYGVVVTIRRTDLSARR